MRQTIEVELLPRATRAGEEQSYELSVVLPPDPGKGVTWERYAPLKILRAGDAEKLGLVTPEAREEITVALTKDEIKGLVEGKVVGEVARIIGELDQRTKPKPVEEESTSVVPPAEPVVPPTDTKLSP